MVRASSPMPVPDGHDEVSSLRQQLRHQQQAHRKLQTMLHNQALAIETFQSKRQMAGQEALESQYSCAVRGLCTGRACRSPARSICLVCRTLSLSFSPSLVSLCHRPNCCLVFSLSLSLSLSLIFSLPLSVSLQGLQESLDLSPTFLSLSILRIYTSSLFINRLVSLSLYAFPLSVQFALNVCVYLFVFFSLCLCLSLSLSHLLSLSLISQCSPSLSLTSLSLTALSLSLSLVALSISHYLLCIDIYIYICLHTSVNRFVSLCVYLSLTLSLPENVHLQKHPCVQTELYTNSLSQSLPLSLSLCLSLSCRMASW